MLTTSMMARSIERLGAKDNPRLSVWIRGDAEHTSRAAKVADIRVVDAFSLFCRHVEGTQGLSMDERERCTTQLNTAWIAK